jgi:hypothetical protein
MPRQSLGFTALKCAFPVLSFGFVVYASLTWPDQIGEGAAAALTAIGNLHYGYGMGCALFYLWLCCIYAKLQKDRDERFWVLNLRSINAVAALILLFPVAWVQQGNIGCFAITTAMCISLRLLMSDAMDYRKFTRI